VCTNGRCLDADVSKSERSVRMLVEDGDDVPEMEIACLRPDEDALGMTVVMTNLISGERRCARTLADGRFRVPIPATIGDRLELDLYNTPDGVTDFKSCDLKVDAPSRRIMTFEQKAPRYNKVGDGNPGCSTDACAQFMGNWFPVAGEAFWDELAPIRDEWEENPETGKWQNTGRQVLDGGGGSTSNSGSATGWQKMPRLMLQKCATMQALRAGWPDAFGGIYAEEEMDRAKVLDLAASGLSNGSGRSGGCLDCRQRRDHRLLGDWPRAFGNSPTGRTGCETSERTQRSRGRNQPRSRSGSSGQKLRRLWAERFEAKSAPRAVHNGVEMPLRLSKVISSATGLLRCAASRSSDRRPPSHHPPNIAAPGSMPVCI
jgi:hypothetical protein